MLFTRKAVAGLLGLAFVLGGPARAAEADKYVPADAEMVLHVNVQQLLGSPLGKKYALPQIEAALKGNEEAKQLLTALGLDPLKDIRSITFSNAGPRGDKVQAALHGKFSTDKIHAAAQKLAEDKKDEFKISKVGGKSLYEHAQKDKAVYGGFADEGTLVVSTSRSYVENALNGKTGKVNKDLADAIASVDGKQSIWLAGVATDELKKLAGRGEGAAVAMKLKTVTGGINVTDAIAVSATARMADAKAARDLGEQANNFKGFLLFAGQANEEVKPFTDEIAKTLEIKARQNDVNVKFKLSEDVIDKAVKKIQGQ